MSNIFISFAKEDRHKVRKLAEALEKQGWSVFWDPVIPSGEAWRNVIDTELEQARCVVVVWSTASRNSDLVQEEAEIGRRRNILIPVLIEDVLPPLGFQSLQAADLFKWDGTTRAPLFTKLVADISNILGIPDVLTQQPEEVQAKRKRGQHSQKLVMVEVQDTAEQADESGKTAAREVELSKLQSIRQKAIRRAVAGVIWGSVIVGIDGVIVGTAVRDNTGLFNYVTWGLMNGVAVGVLVGAIIGLAAGTIGPSSSTPNTFIGWGILIGIVGGVILGPIGGPTVFGAGGWVPMTMYAVFYGVIVGGIAGVVRWMISRAGR
jgi:hypothetical protein